jgi:hypothetical protein
MFQGKCFCFQTRPFATNLPSLQLVVGFSCRFEGIYFYLIVVTCRACLSESEVRKAIDKKETARGHFLLQEGDI